MINTWKFICNYCKEKNECIQIRQGVSTTFSLVKGELFVKGSKINFKVARKLAHAVGISFNTTCPTCGHRLTKQQIILGTKRWFRSLTPEEIAELLGHE